MHRSIRARYPADVGGWWLTLGMVLACTYAARAHADDVTALRERLLSGVERSATGVLSEDSADALIAIFEDTREVRHVRLRALFALGQLGGARVSGFFEELLARGSVSAEAAKVSTRAARDVLDPGRSSLVLRHAVDGLVRAAPSDATVTLIAPYLEHRDGRVREAVARGLVRVGTPRARELAQLRMTHEPSKLVRAQLSLLTAPVSISTGRPVPPTNLPMSAPESAQPPR
jgi:HEAT repeat protein